MLYSAIEPTSYEIICFDKIINFFSDQRSHEVFKKKNFQIVSFNLDQEAFFRCSSSQIIALSGQKILIVVRQ